MSKLKFKLLYLPLCAIPLFTCQINAAAYTTSLFPWEKHQLQSLSWNIDNITADNSSAVTLEYLTKNINDDTDIWQQIDDFDCNFASDQLECHTNLPSDLQSLLQFRLQYPELSSLKSFNYQLNKTPPVEDQPNIDNQRIFYSKFKNLNPDLIPSTISWKEASLSAQATDRLLVQTRATYDQKKWTPWSGNFISVFDSASDSIDDIDLEATNEAIIFSNLPPLEFSKIQVSFIDLNSPLRLSQPAANDNDEAAAFSKLAFNLSSLEDIQIGETLFFRETLGDTTYLAQAIVSDLKPGENLVTVFDWQGTIPYQLPTNCQGNKFCFSTQAEIYRLQDYFVDFSSNQKNHKYFQLDLPSIKPEITNWQLLNLTEPLCLTSEDNACLMKGLSLSSYSQNDKKPMALQYRLIYGDNKDVLATEIFLNQDQTTILPNNAAPTLNRLRGNKVFDPANNSRPYYWN